MKYKILFAGLGSIGKRHLKNVVDFLDARGDTCEIAAIRSDVTKQTELYSDLITKTYSYDEEISKEYDILFVTNPTSKHYDTIKKYSKNVKHIFIEKPVFDKSDENIETLNLKKDGVYYVAAPLRYNAALQYVKNNLDLSKVISVRSICSSYLPDWRPGQDYRSTYSAHKELGGGVAIDLIHEWDYFTWLFGVPDAVYCLSGHNSELEINSEDIAIYIAKKGKLTFELHLDYFGRKTMRELQLFMPDDTVNVDIANGEIHYLCSGKTIAFHEERNDYQIREIAHFFDMVDHKTANDNDINEALKTMKIAEGKLT